jgi:TonB family protein
VEPRPEAYNFAGAIDLLLIAQWRGTRELDLPSEPFQPSIEPQLAWKKTGRLEEFFSSVVALVRGPVPPKEFFGASYFRDCWIDQKFPKLAFAGAVALQALLIVYPPPIWKIPPARIVSASTETELTWYGPVKDFPAILPAVVAPKAPHPADTLRTPPHRGADAYHPRQTILSEPLHPTHPRQTLIQPKAPQEAPKFLPALPNIVKLAETQPSRPKLELTPEQLAAMRPEARAAVAAPNTVAPIFSTPEKQVGAINIASSSLAPQQPLLPVTAMSPPLAAPQKAVANATAPSIGGLAGDSETLIALSAAPAPVAPPPAIPAGNLSARFSISPDGPQPGTPGGAVSGNGASSGAAGGGGRGPEGIFISGGNAANSGPVSGLGIGPASRGAGDALPSRPVPRVRIAPEGLRSLASDAAEAAETSPKLGLTPQHVLGAKRVYTLHVNMPNLTSASGSWVLNFAELNELETVGYAKPGAQDLAGPVPLRKVDPKYPPELRTAHVDGEVVLYAIIRKDGSVDSIQLVHSVDPLLDANAMEALAQWKFQSAEKHGEPVDLEAVVYIPFRSRAPQY